MTQFNNTRNCEQKDAKLIRSLPKWFLIVFLEKVIHNKFQKCFHTAYLTLGTLLKTESSMQFNSTILKRKKY